jgi:hypothetical protein
MTLTIIAIIFGIMGICWSLSIINNGGTILGFALLLLNSLLLCLNITILIEKLSA